MWIKSCNGFLANTDHLIAIRGREQYPHEGTNKPWFVVGDAPNGDEVILAMCLSEEAAKGVVESFYARLTRKER